VTEYVAASMHAWIGSLTRQSASLVQDFPVRLDLKLASNYLQVGNAACDIRVMTGGEPRSDSRKVCLVLQLAQRPRKPYSCAFTRIDLIPSYSTLKR
jgi:hypothetical protein